MPNWSPIKWSVRMKEIRIIGMISISAIYIRRTNIRSWSRSYNGITIVTNMYAIVYVNIYIVSISVNRVATDVGVFITNSVIVV
ncbi:hypothetical protein D3C84_948200 [compost metagenome]